jgi:hypothetical protein
MVLARITVGWPLCSTAALIRGVDLAVVVAAALEIPELVVAQVLDQLAQPRVGPKKCSRM